MSADPRGYVKFDDLPIPYLQRVRDYYLALGYPRPYVWVAVVLIELRAQTLLRSPNSVKGSVLRARMTEETHVSAAPASHRAMSIRYFLRRRGPSLAKRSTAGG